MNKPNLIYVIIAHRFGDDNQHSYFVGCNTSKDKALEMAQKEEEYRGGKYECWIYKTSIDGVWEEGKEYKKLTIK